MSFLILVNYLNKFSLYLTKLAKPYHDLLSKNNMFNWMLQQQEAFDNIKEEISKTTMLKCFDVKTPFTLQIDASVEELGAALLQKEMPIAFVSKILTGWEI